MELRRNNLVQHFCIQPFWNKLVPLFLESVLYNLSEYGTGHYMATRIKKTHCIKLHTTDSTNRGKSSFQNGCMQKCCTRLFLLNSKPYYSDLYIVHLVRKPFSWCKTVGKIFFLLLVSGKKATCSISF